MAYILISLLVPMVAIAFFISILVALAQEESRRKKNTKVDEDEFERKMNELASSSSFDLNNFVLDLVRNLTPAQAKNLDAIKEIKEVEDCCANPGDTDEIEVGK